MKKLIALSALIPVIMLCSCSAANEPAEICVNRVFNAQIDIQQNGTAYTADFTCHENGCSAVFLSPEELKGMSISIEGDEITYSLGGLEFTANENKHQTQVVSAVYSAIVSLPENATLNEGTYILQGTSKHGNYIMYLNKENFTPTLIEYEDKDITVKFRSIT